MEIDSKVDKGEVEKLQEQLLSITGSQDLNSLYWLLRGNHEFEGLCGRVVRLNRKEITLKNFSIDSLYQVFVRPVRQISYSLTHQQSISNFDGTILSQQTIDVGSIDNICDWSICDSSSVSLGVA